MKPTAPALVMLAPAASACVPPEKAPKLSVVPAAPLNGPLLVPPPDRDSVPLCTCTLPVLFRAASRVVVPLPADFRRVPALLNVGWVPVFQTSRASPCTSTVPPAGLLITAALEA